MALRLVLSPVVKFPVKGALTAEDGQTVDFDFTLTADRIGTSAQVGELTEAIRIAEAAGSKTPITDCLAPRVRGWHGVEDTDGEPMPFTEQALCDLLNLPGAATLVLAALLRASSVRAA
jgi:hypothetical protein